MKWYGYGDQRSQSAPTRSTGRSQHGRADLSALGYDYPVRIMSDPRTALDLWPLVRELPHDEQLKLAKLALKAAASNGDDGKAYQATPPGKQEFSSDEDPLAWEGDGWEEFSAPR